MTALAFYALALLLAGVALWLGGVARALLRPQPIAAGLVLGTAATLLLAAHVALTAAADAVGIEVVAVQQRPFVCMGARSEVARVPAP